MPHVQKSHEYTCYQSSPRNGNYNSFIEFCKRVLTLTSISGWNLQELKDRIILTRSNHLLLLPEIELMIAKSLGCTIWIFRWRLLEDHDLYTNSVRATTKIISNLVKDLEKTHTCPGVKPTERCCHVLPHVILKFPGNPLFDDPGPSFPHEEFWRPNNCALLLEVNDLQWGGCSKYSHCAGYHRSCWNADRADCADWVLFFYLYINFLVKFLL